MALPKYEEIMLPLLRELASSNGEVNQATIINPLAKYFSLTDEDIQARLPSGRQTYFSNRCHWAKFYLTRAGLIESTRRGYFKITPTGTQLVANPPKQLDRDSLFQIPQFKKWWDETSAGSEEIDEPQGRPAAKVSKTPDEQIDIAAKQLLSALESELLGRIRTVDPTLFEQVVVDLLIAMGFGGGDPEMGKRVGRSGDGGIDGIINEDSLGLDAVYIQAKRYQNGNSIGSPQLHAFIGSLVGQRASKGVFVTTSHFTADARTYAATVQHRVVLIDGDELARLLVRYGVGVRDERVITIKKLDEDYFTET